MVTIKIVLLIGTLVFLEVFLIFWYAQALGRRRTKEVMKKFEGQPGLAVSASANFFGQLSKGFAQWRGQGVLVLANNEIYYERWVPKGILRIPLSNIEKVEVVDSFLHKTKFRPLLRIDFKNEEGKPDAAAWLVNDVKEWKEAIKRAKGQ